MALFAEMSGEAMVGVIAAAMAAIKLAEKVYDNWRLDRAAKALAAKVEAEAAKTAAALAATVRETSAEKQAHLDKQDAVLEEIRKAQVSDSGT